MDDKVRLTLLKFEGVEYRLRDVIASFLLLLMAILFLSPVRLECIFPVIQFPCIILTHS